MHAAFNDTTALFPYLPQPVAKHPSETRAKKHDPAHPDANEFYVHGQMEHDGTWMFVPCRCAECPRTPDPACKFSTVKKGMQHEPGALRTQRDTWKNLAPIDRAVSNHVSAEHDSTRAAVEAAGEAMRNEIRKLMHMHFIDMESASAKQLQAMTLDLQDAIVKISEADRAEQDAAKKRAQRHRFLSTDALRTKLNEKV